MPGMVVVKLPQRWMPRVVSRGHACSCPNVGCLEWSWSSCPSAGCLVWSVVVLTADAAPVLDASCGRGHASSCASVGRLMWACQHQLPQCWSPRVVVGILPQCWLPRVVSRGHIAPVLAASCGQPWSYCPSVGCLVWSWSCMPAAAPVLDASNGRGHASSCAGLGLWVGGVVRS